MKFKAGDKVKRKDGCKFSNGKTVVTVERYAYGNPWFVETQSHLSESKLELVEEAKEMTHDYEEGEWYTWNGGDCPLHPEDNVEVKVFDVSTGRVTSFNLRPVDKVWTHKLSLRVFAFKITKKYTPPVAKEMTIEEISKALGYDVKIVKG